MSLDKYKNMFSSYNQGTRIYVVLWQGQENTKGKLHKQERSFISLDYEYIGQDVINPKNIVEYNLRCTNLVTTEIKTEEMM